MEGKRKRLKVLKYQDLTPSTNTDSRYPKWYLKN